MAQPHRRIVGEAQRKVTADLLRAPPLEQQLGDHGAKLFAGLKPPPVVTCSPGGGAAMSVERAIPATGDSVAPQLP